MKHLATPFLLIHQYWDLLKGFIRKDIKGRFAGTFAGLLWTLLSPVSRMLAYFFVFSIVLRVTVTVEETGTDRFAVFFLCGFFPWVLFSETLNKALTVLLGNASIITKVVFPVELLPCSLVISNFIMQGIGFACLLIYLAIAGFANPVWLMIPVYLIILFLFTLGLAFFLSALCVFIRDLSELFSIIIMLWFFGTPIIYPASNVPDHMMPVLTLNPMASMVDLFRDSILMGRIDTSSLATMTVFSLVSYYLGTWFFIRSKGAFGDVL